MYSLWKWKWMLSYNLLWKKNINWHSQNSLCDSSHLMVFYLNVSLNSFVYIRVLYYNSCCLIHVYCIVLCCVFFIFVISFIYILRFYITIQVVLFMFIAFFCVMCDHDGVLIHHVALSLHPVIMVVASICSMYKTGF